MIPVPVNADLPAARVPFGSARLGVLVARRAWPQSPCNGHEQVMVGWDIPKWRDMPAPAKGTVIVGLANLAGRNCLIWIHAGMQRSATCSTVVHEAGHWAGMEHADADRFPVMAAVDGDYPGCEVPR